MLAKNENQQQHSLVCISKQNLFEFRKKATKTHKIFYEIKNQMRKITTRIGSRKLYFFSVRCVLCT